MFQKSLKVFQGSFKGVSKVFLDDTVAQNIDICVLGEASLKKNEKIWDNVPIRVDPSPPPTFGLADLSS